MHCHRNPTVTVILDYIFVRGACCFALLWVLSSCSSADPDCGDPESQKIVLKIFERMDTPERLFEAAPAPDAVEKSIKSTLSDNGEFAHNSLFGYLARRKYSDDFQKDQNSTIAKINPFDWITGIGSYTLEFVRLAQRNSDTKAVVCAATARLTALDYGTATQDINFKIEKTTDGKPYVTVLSVGSPVGTGLR